MASEVLGHERYHALPRILHWGMALAFLFMWGCGFAMKYVVEEEGHLEELLFGAHISGGVTLVFLMMLRLAARFIYRPPALSKAIPEKERKMAHVGHIALYLLPLSVLALGWAEVDLGGWGVNWFGIEMPKIFPTMEMWNGINLEELTEFLHKWLAWGMLGLVVLHIAAVVKHRRDGHDVLHRMGFGKNR